MDREATAKKMKSLYQKAKDARVKGNFALSRTFKAGAARLQRELKADTIRQKAHPKPAAEAPAS